MLRPLSLSLLACAIATMAPLAGGCVAGGEDADLATAPGSEDSGHDHAAPTAPARPADEIPPFAPHMAWHQGNRTGFTSDELSLLETQPYAFVVIPKMHREDVVVDGPAGPTREDYYTSLQNAVEQLAPYQANVWGYFNAHDYFSRYALAGFDPSAFASSSACTGSGCDPEDVQMTYDADSATAHAYVEAALQQIRGTANGIYVDFSWGESGLGVLAPYILRTASALFGDNVVVNQKSVSNAEAVRAQLAPGNTWYAHIEEAGPDFFPCSQRPEMCSRSTADRLASRLRADETLRLRGVVLTSQPCSETDAGTWGDVRYYEARGRACNDPAGCVFECNAGYSCEGDTCGGG